MAFAGSFHSFGLLNGMEIPIWDFLIGVPLHSQMVHWAHAREHGFDVSNFFFIQQKKGEFCALTRDLLLLFRFGCHVLFSSSVFLRSKSKEKGSQQGNSQQR